MKAVHVVYFRHGYKGINCVQDHGKKTKEQPYNACKDPVLPWSERALNYNYDATPNGLEHSKARVCNSQI